MEGTQIVHFVYPHRNQLLHNNDRLIFEPITPLFSISTCWWKGVVQKEFSDGEWSELSRVPQKKLNWQRKPCINGRDTLRPCVTGDMTEALCHKTSLQFPNALFTWSKNAPKTRLFLLLLHPKSAEEKNIQPENAVCVACIKLGILSHLEHCVTCVKLPSFRP